MKKVMKPFVGCPVVLVPGVQNPHLYSNGNKSEDPIAAIVTRVWSDDAVNLVCFPDHGAQQICGSVLSKSALEARNTGSIAGSAYWEHCAPFEEVDIDLGKAPLQEQA
jgi:hypothetical protein